MKKPSSDRPSRRDILRLTAVGGISLALGGTLTRELLHRARLHRVSATRTQLGTLVTVTAIHPDAPLARSMVERAFAEIERLEDVLSRHRPTSALARLNRDGVLAHAPSELIHVLGRALEYGTLTEGAFDVTVAPLLSLYSSRFQVHPGTLPSAGEVRAALAAIDYRQVRIVGEDIRIVGPGTRVTLDGIAKGYVVDRAVETLVAAGAGRVMIDAGGDIASGGAEGGGEPWRVAIRDPRAPSSMGTVQLRGRAVASSGDYMQSFTEDRSAHHILDPRTGRSPEHTSAVSVVAPTALDADALSTAAFVMGPVEGLALLERLEGVEGMIVSKDQTRYRTRGFDRYLG